MNFRKDIINLYSQNMDLHNRIRVLEQQKGNNKRSLKNIKENWIILIPQGIFCFLEIIIVFIGFTVLVDITKNIQDPYPRLFGVIIIIIAMMKMISWFGFEGLTQYGKTWTKVMEK